MTNFGLFISGLLSFIKLAIVSIVALGQVSITEYFRLVEPVRKIPGLSFQKQLRYQRSVNLISDLSEPC